MLDVGPIHQSEYELELDRSGQYFIAEAPGRMHFLGEHGEPNGSFLISAAIDRYIRVAVSTRKDNSLRFFAADLGEKKRSTLVNLKFKREDRWANYIKTAILVYAELGLAVKGLNFTIAGNIPQNVGLASSTAIEIAAAIALKAVFRVQINERDLAYRLGKAHKALFGDTVPPVDYLIGLMACKEQFLFIDESSLEIRTIASPLSRYRILLMDSRVPRIDVVNEIASRQADTQKGLLLLSSKKYRASFRTLETEDLLESMGNLPEQIRRRSLHVVQENNRIHEAVNALERKDIAAWSRILFNSHESLRDLYEVSCPEVDWLVKRAQETDGSAGSRMTGNGFGGCIYAFVRNDLLEDYNKRLEDYERIFGFRPVIYEIKLSSGGRVVPVKGRVYAS